MIPHSRALAVAGLPLFLIALVESPLPQAAMAAVVVAQADAASSYSDALLDRARGLLDAQGTARNPELAARILREAASTGSVAAMQILARLYATGDGVPQDFNAAEKLLKDAISVGSVSSGAAALGDLYLSQTPPRAPDALAAYEQAIGAGNTYVMRQLAGLLAEEKGPFPTDRVRAEALLKQAVAAGDVSDGGADLGDFYLSGKPPQVADAAAAYDRAIAAGNVGAMLKLSRVMLAGGDGVSVDGDRARSLIEDAIAAGNIRAGSLALGNFYRSQPAPDYAAAAEAYRNSADAGETWALLALADMAAKGQGEPASFSRAKRLIEQAIAAGAVEPGAEALGDLYLNASAPDRDPVKAAAAYQQAIDAGNVGVMLTLARLLRSGDGIEPDPQRALALIEGAIAAGLVRDGAAALGDFHRAAEPASAIRAYEQAIDNGNVRATLSLADMLQRGEGAPVDLARARALIEQGIAGGEVRHGAFALGQLLMKLDPPDVKGAVAAYEQSIDAGGTAAMLELATLLQGGDGVPPDRMRARALIQSAIDGGDVSSGEFALGDFLRNATPPDMPGAVAAYERAIAAGNTRAMLVLAAILRSGDGVPADKDKARGLIETVIASGNIGAGQSALGDFLRLEGKPVEAAAAYQVAVDAGNPWAMLSLAELVRHADGVPFDFARARELIEAAIAAGNTVGGQVALGDLYREAAPPDYDPARAAASYQLAADGGDAGAMLTLARMLIAGEGVTADRGRARELIEASIAAGNVQAGAAALGNLLRQSDPPDSTGAVAAYQQAIDAGSTWAMLSMAEMVLAGEGVAADPDKAKGLIERAIAGGNVSAGAFALGNLYRLAATPDTELALASYEQAAAAGNAEADLLAARLISVRYLEADGRRRMVDHLVSASRSIAPRRVALEMLQLPSAPLIAAVQQLLSDSGERVGVPDGTHGARTKRAIRDFCARESVADCDEEFITVDLVTALLSQPPATQ